MLRYFKSGTIGSGFKTSQCKTEDVAAATGALSAAQGAYDNDFIYARRMGDHCGESKCRSHCRGQSKSD